VVSELTSRLRERLPLGNGRADLLFDRVDLFGRAENRVFVCVRQDDDPVGIGRALYTNLQSDEVQQGGSTITQQYVKNVYLTNEVTVERKLKEAVLAIKLDQELPKQEILERYLNTIYFGRGAYGIEAASRAYFGKHVNELGLPRRKGKLGRNRRSHCAV